MEVYTVGIICPCTIEYNKCVEILELANETTVAGRLISFKALDGLNIFAVKAGPGKIQCASATQLIIDRYKPDLIIDVGAAGSLSEEIGIFTIIFGDKCYEYDVCQIEELTDIPDDLVTRTILCEDSFKGLMKGFIDWIREQEGSNVVIGSIASGERNVDNKNLRIKLHTALNAVGCNWESSAILKTAELNGIKSISFRVVTDKADENMAENLKNNWENALELLFKTLKRFISNGWLNKLAM